MLKVKLVSHSTPAPDLIEDGLHDLGDLVAFCARVSNPSNQLNTENDKLINYLLKNAHFSPLEMVNVCMSIETTRDIARQILRHRSFSFQEYSQRYADPTKDLDFVIREARLQDTKNRQNSVELDPENDGQTIMAGAWRNKQQQLLDLAKDTYQWAIDNGIAKEQARAVLPEGLTVSRLYMNGTLRSWIHYLQVRSGNGTQKEHMEIALECAKVIAKVFPMASQFTLG